MREHISPIKHHRHYGFYAVCAAFLLVLLALAGVVLRLPLLRFKTFEITGNSRVATGDILVGLRAYPARGALGRVLGYSHMLAWRSGEVALPEKLFANVAVDRDFFRRVLRVKVTERARAIVWCSSAGMCRWLDNEGVVLEEAPEARGRLITLIDDSAPELAPIGSAMVAQSQFAYIVRIVDILRENMITPDKLRFDREALELVVVLPTGIRFLFSIRTDPGFVATALPAVLKKVDPTQTEYVDFRIENKAYYQPRI